jgi:hypothetical protein
LLLLLALPGLRQLVVGFSLPGPGFFPCQPMWTFWLAACYFNRFIWVLVFHGHCHSISNITFINPQWYIILANVSSNYIKHFTLSVLIWLNKLCGSSGAVFEMALLHSHYPYNKCIN